MISLLVILLFYLAIYNLSINIGEALGPLLGGGFTNFYSFDHACYFTSFLCIIYSCVYILSNYERIKKESSEENDEDSKSINLLGVSSRRDSVDRFPFVSRQRAHSTSARSRKSSMC
jgi:hypothetical protein